MNKKDKLKKIAKKINIENTKMIYNSKNYNEGNKIPEGYTKEMNALQNKYRYAGKRRKAELDSLEKVIIKKYFPQDFKKKKLKKK